MPLVVDEIVQISYRGRCFGQRILLVTNWRVDTTASTASVLDDLTNIATDFEATSVPGSICDVYMACLATDYTLEAVRAQVVRPSRSLYVDRTSAAVGTGQSACETANLAGTVTRVSLAAGRKGIATNHLGPLPSDAMVDGGLDSLQLGALGQWGVDFASPRTVTAGTIALLPVILHPVGSPIASSDILTFRTSNTVRVMRRRTLHVGE